MRNDLKERTVCPDEETPERLSGKVQQVTSQEVSPGAEMVVIEVCRGEVSGCPNALISTADWKKAAENWARERNVYERLRSRIKGDKVLLHHKLRVSISGCPNGCSRPQIADVGWVGFVHPTVAKETCTACGACAAACPDAAISVSDGPPEFDMTACQGCTRCRDACPAGCITLSTSGVRIMLGGKLGRHPRLAEIVGEEMAPSAVIALLDRVIRRYLECAAPEERFADFLVRSPGAWRS